MSSTKKILIIPIILMSLFICRYVFAVDLTPKGNIISIDTTIETVESKGTIDAPEITESTKEKDGHGENTAQTFLWIAIILIAAKFSSLVERFGQPAVLGELLVGVLLGNLVLLGINFFEPIKNDSILSFLSELGVVILLFQIGLESNIEKMKSVGVKAFMVATVGVITPFVLGTYIVGPL